MRLTISWSDIVRGVRRDPERCPAVLAARRSLAPPVLRATPALLEWMRAFDIFGTAGVVPESFELEVGASDDLLLDRASL